jgi:hypothetical protein
MLVFRDEQEVAMATLVPLSPSEESEFRQNGFLLLRSVLPPSDVEVLLAEVDRLVRQAAGAGAVLREPYYHENSYKLVRILRLSTAFDALIDHPGYFGRLVSLIGSHIQLMGSEIFVRGAAGESITGFHTDCGPGMQAVLPDDANAFLQIKMQLFLTDLSAPDASNFVVIPGSHRTRVTESNRLCMIDSVNGRMGPNGVLPDEAVQILAQPGDVLLFPHSLWHAVASNHSGRTRYSIALRYGLTALRPMERFDPVLTDPERTLTPRQRRLLGDFGAGDSSPYRPPDQDAIIVGGTSTPPAAGGGAFPRRASHEASPDVITPRRGTRSEDPIVETARVGLSTSHRSCERYLAALEEAVEEEPLPCGTALYAKLHLSASESGQWTVLSLLTSASQEAEEAKRLWARATDCGDVELRQKLKQSAAERSEQVVAYLTLIDIVFPEALTAEFRDELGALAPGYTLVQPLPEPDEARPPVSPPEVVLLNLEALRKAVLTDLRRSAILERCPAGDHSRAVTVLDRLRRDHVDQVAWTAGWLEQAVHEGELDDLGGLIVSCLRDFNRATTEEAIDLSYHQRFGSHP